MLIYSNEGEKEKLVPHPHDEVAFGLLILKLEPISSSLKSILAPPKNCKDVLSMMTLQLPFAKT